MVAASLFTALNIATSPVIGDLIDKASEWLCNGYGKPVLEDIGARSRAYFGEIPPNCDLAHALRLAELTGSLVILEHYARTEAAGRFDHRGGQEPPFIYAARKFLHEQLGLKWGSELKPDKDVAREIEARLDPVLGSRSVDEVRSELRTAQSQVWATLVAGATKYATPGVSAIPPPEFETMFAGCEKDQPGWALVFLAFVREALKDKPCVQAAFMTTRLAALGPALGRVNNQLGRIEGDMNAGFEAVNARIDLILQKQGRDEAERERMKAELEVLRQKYEASRAVLATELERVGADVSDPDQLLAQLRAVLSQYREMKTALKRVGNDRPEARLLKDRAVAALEVGDIAAARGLLAEIRLLDRKEQDERRADYLAARANGADTCKLQARAALADRDVAVAVDFCTEGLDLLAEGEAESRWRFASEVAQALLNYGSTAGSNEASQGAVQLYRRSLNEVCRESDPQAWAETQNNLGIALKDLGERESGRERLDDAVRSFREALRECSQMQLPDLWAKIQSNLANTLTAIGDRTFDRIALDEAIAACRLALQVFTLESNPDEWAGAQHHLGIALRLVGEREENPDTLNLAVDASNAALTGWTRWRVPLDWAAAENSLATSLWRLGERESGTLRLEQAIAAYRAALKEWRREHRPRQWAAVQNNLGSALLTLGIRTKEVRLLRAAVDCQRAALQERPREETPFEWASTQNNLGASLKALAVVSGEIGPLDEAISAYHEAAEEWTPDYSPRLSAMVRTNTANALQEKAIMQDSITLLEEAITIYHIVLQEPIRDHAVLQWVDAQEGLGSALFRLDEKQNDTNRLQEAVISWNSCLAIGQSAWPTERIEAVRTRRDNAQAEVDRRKAALDTSIPPPP